MKQATTSLLILSILCAQPLLAVADDVSVATQQRLSVIVGSTTGATSIAAW